MKAVWRLPLPGKVIIQIMEQENHINYERIAGAIAFIRANFKEQPSLDEMAAAAHMSLYHFQRTFTAWAGVSPKKFLQFISLNYAKDLLVNNQATLFEASLNTGLSGTGRLHDLFFKTEAMTPGEFKSGGKGLHIQAGFYDSMFGRALVASTGHGICHLSFVESEASGREVLFHQFPGASIHWQKTDLHFEAIKFLQQEETDFATIKLHLKGTPFQLKVWEALLKIPPGQLKTYGGLAKSMGNEKASRAVGTAIGANPVAFLIPCHRVIRGDGQFGGYRWGLDRKVAMIGLEAAKIHTEHHQTEK